MMMRLFPIPLFRSITSSPQLLMLDGAMKVTLMIRPAHDSSVCDIIMRGRWRERENQQKMVEHRFLRETKCVLSQDHRFSLPTFAPTISIIWLIYKHLLSLLSFYFLLLWFFPSISSPSSFRFLMRSSLFPFSLSHSISWDCYSFIVLFVSIHWKQRKRKRMKNEGHLKNEKERKGKEQVLSKPMLG